LSSGSDITERRQAEIREKALHDQLTRAERLETVGVLAGGGAHDLNNILGPLVMLPELIQDDLALAIKGDSGAISNIEESIGIMHSSAKRAANVVKELLTLSRRGHYERKPLNINLIASMQPDSSFIHNIKSERPDITIAFKTCNSPLTVLASESHLGRVMENLIRNAVDASQKGGTVNIRTFNQHLDTEYNGYTIVPPGDYAVIEVRDTGCGIRPDDLSRIFEPFYTSKNKSERSGSGLGLSVVHGIIGDHKGYIDVSSTVGSGTVFALYLPLTQTVTGSHEQERRQPTMNKGSILVVDDERSQRLLARTALSRLGFSVDLAEHGTAAIKLFADAKASERKSPYQFVVLDMRM
jgi:signal transduction histidine kinase